MSVSVRCTHAQWPEGFQGDGITGIHGILGLLYGAGN